jgi:VanZ family protein
MKRFLWYWLPVLVWMGVLFVFSAQPELPSPEEPGSLLDTVVHKGGHLVAYGVLAWLCLRALGQVLADSAGLRLLCVGVAMAYGLTDEFHQTFVPGRRGRLQDVLVDGVGAAIAMGLIWWLERWRTRTRRASEA